MNKSTIEKFASGTHNREPNEKIPQDAAQDSQNFVTRDGRVMLSYGRSLVGNRGGPGKTRNVGSGYNTLGTKIKYRKKGTVIQWLNGATWTDVTGATGLTESHEYRFTNYSSLSGAYTYAFGRGGIFKMNNGAPGTAINMYDAAINFHGKAFIDKGRSIMFDIENDPTGLRGSYIDAQNSTVYTTVTNEVLATGDGVQTTFSGTLGFKAGNPLGTAFGLSINMNPSGITATDNFIGVISGTGVTGTINYTTGAYSLIFAVAPAGATQVRVTYQWENSNNKGVTDYRYSTTRLAGEGFILRQDEGGDAILNVLVGLDGSYYSIKSVSVYKLTLDTTDTKPDNNVYRKDIGIPFWQAAVATGKGIVFMNTANPEKPELTILEKNPLGDNIEPRPLVPHYKFENYDMTECNIESWQQWIVVTAKNFNSVGNDVMFLVDIVAGTVDRIKYRCQCMSKDGATLYIGDTITENVFSLFDGFDDDQKIIDAYWTSKADLLEIGALKKVRRQRFQGQIDPGQVVEVYIGTDDGVYTLYGTIRGDVATVTTPGTGMVGSSMVGEDAVATSGVDVSVGTYFFEIKPTKLGKFRKRAVKFVPKSYGYFDCSYIQDWDIMVFEDRIPEKFRRKQNVSLNGISTDQPA